MYLQQINLINDSLINSPLENSDLFLLNFKDNIIQLLTYGYFLNLLLIYFILVLFMVVTTKFVSDKKLSFEFVKSFPLGKYIYIIIEKTLLIWKYNNILWTYLILFFMLISILGSTYALYVTLFILK